MHIGSQITDLAPFRNAFALLHELVGELRADGLAIELVDLGGGLGIPYRTTSRRRRSRRLCRASSRTQSATSACELIFEPGRLIAGNAGILVTARALS